MKNHVSTWQNRVASVSRVGVRASKMIEDSCSSQPFVPDPLADGNSVSKDFLHLPQS